MDKIRAMRALVIVGKVLVGLVILAFSLWVARWHIDKKRHEKVLAEINLPADPEMRRMKLGLEAGVRKWMEDSPDYRDAELLGCYPMTKLWGHGNYTCAELRVKNAAGGLAKAKLPFLVHPEDFSVIHKYDVAEFLQKRKFELANMPPDAKALWTPELQRLCEIWQIPSDL